MEQPHSPAQETEASFSLAPDPIDVPRLSSEMSDEAAGACVTFEGRVRNHNEGRPVAQLEYEAYPRMALQEGARVLAEAREHFAVLDARCVHRVGRLAIGETAVWVGVISAHRDEGFAACRYIIDEVKKRVPIWKKEHYREGDTSWVVGS